MVMDNYMNFKIISEKKLILEYYSGKISVNDLINQKTLISNKLEYSPNYNIIHDFREVEFDINEEQGVQLLNFFESNKAIYSNRRVAHLTYTPKQVAVTNLFTLLLKEQLIAIEVTSTLEAAIQWVNLSINDYFLIESYFNMLKMKYNCQRA
jgi:hypothetical protein